MNKILKSLRLTVIAATLGAFAIPAPITTFAEEDMDYVALGDSLAYGVTPAWDGDSIPENSYPHLLAHHIDELGELDTFTNQYSYPGYTTEDVLNDLQEDVRMPSSEEDNTGIRTTVSEAEIVTISAGANDILQELTINENTGEVTYDPESFEQRMQQIGANLSKTVSEIRSLNGDAEVYIMGYYNPYPRMEADQKQMLNLALEEMNSVINQVATATDSTYVGTSEALSAHALDYLPDPTDIHPNELGYQVIANEFWEEVEIQDASDFTDVSSDSFAKESIDYLTSKKILQGYGGGKFAPNQEVTRAEATLMLDRSIVFNTEVPPAPDYSDIDDTMVAYHSISKMTAQGVMEGFTDVTFRPDDSLTRGQMAKILVNAFELEPLETETGFSDISESYWAYPFIETLAAHDVALGYEDGTFKPGDTVTRQELAAFVKRSMDLD